MQVWQGEELIWLEPSAQQISRETRARGDLRYEILHVPAERFNIFTVVHLDEKRRLYPRGEAPAAWHQGLPAPLYLQWLNTPPRFVPAESALTFTIVGREITLSERPGTRAMIRLDPCGPTEDKTTPVTVAWPPPGFDTLPPVSPEEEGKLRYAALAAQRGGDEIPVMQLDWPEPFDRLFPTGGGLDLLHGWFLMHQCVTRWRTGQQATALQEAERWVSKLTGETPVPLSKAWFWPKALANPDGAPYEVKATFGIDVATGEQALVSAPFQAELRKPVPVRRVIGWLGYFWWELYQDFTTQIPVGYCTDCGNIIRGGHRDRASCTRQENPACFRARAARRQRQSRAARNRRQQGNAQ